MTTTAQPEAAVQQTPDTSARFMDDVIANIAQDAVKQSLPEPEPENAQPVKEPEPTPESITREDGATWNADANRWTKDGKFVAGEAPVLPEPATEPEATEPETAEPALPEGFAAVKKVEGRELATPFTVLDGDLELEVPDITIKFTASGKERTEPLDRVVRFAQVGFANQEREQRFEQIEQRSQTTETKNAELQDQLRTMQIERERLLSDPDFLVQQLAQFETQNTPEARAQRAEQELKHARQEREFRALAEAGTRFFEGEMVPAVEQMLKALPLVSEEEIGAKLILISDRYKAQTPFGTIVPETQYDAVRQAVIRELVPWAQQLQITRESDRRTVTKDATAKQQAAEQQARTAQIEAQKAKRFVGRALKPGPQSGTTPRSTVTQSPPPRKPIVTVQDAEDAALRDTMAAVMGGTAA